MLASDVERPTERLRTVPTGTMMEQANMSERSPKEAVLDLVQQLPDESTLEDIQYSIYVREVLQKRLEELPNTRLVTHDEVERRMAKWLGK